ncbi:YbbR-like protein [Paraliobacillus sp. PM-2]|uniref:CdaR family protein n=1 Tax=Paraliobacillus sp. PM-2 TaxID=1462524 RepID=UPI00061C1BDE|nr:CdaR family protein [Paraliobacillus sp. PM-2]CQR48468.1 YbbR-like protein [Paraliobacillus sp. PM-2]
MNDWLNKPWVIRVISLILALLIFTVIRFDNQDSNGDALRLDLFSSSQETQIVNDVPINVKLDDKYAVSGVPDTATITLEGTVSVVQSTATQRNFDVFVDLEDLEPGTYTVPLEYEGISDRLNVTIDPEVIEVTIEERASAEFEVKVDYTNENLLAPGYELQEASVNPSTVKITSSKSVIDRISVVKAFVDVEGIQESVEIEDVKIRVYDSEGNELSARIEPETVDVMINVDNPNKSVPVSVQTTGETPDGIKITSITPNKEEVQVFASETDLEGLTEIETEAIDLSDINEDTSIEVNLNQLEYVRLINPNTIRVNIKVDREIKTTFEDVSIEIKDVDNPYTASFVEETSGAVDITVSGYESKLGKIEASDLSVSVDASDLNPGKHELPIDISAPEGLNISLARETVTIRIE